MNKNNFTEKDYDNLVDFLNYIANKAQFNQNVKESIQFVKLLNNIQVEILPKIKDHILEIKEVKHKDKKEAKE